MVSNFVVFFVCTLFNDQEQEGRDTFWSKINVRKLSVYLRRFLVGLSTSS